MQLCLMVVVFSGHSVDAFPALEQRTSDAIHADAGPHLVVIMFNILLDLLGCATISRCEWLIPCRVNESGVIWRRMLRITTI